MPVTAPALRGSQQPKPAVSRAGSVTPHMFWCPRAPAFLVLMVSSCMSLGGSTCRTSILHVCHRRRGCHVHSSTQPPGCQDPDPPADCLAAGIQQRLARTADLRAALDQAGQIRHVRLLRCALADVEGGSHSLAEINLVRLCRRHRLRPPDEQQFRHDQEGRRRYLDATWLLRDGRRLVLEVDGGLHLRIDAWWSDMARERDVVIRVGQVLRCSSVEIRVRPDAVAHDLARAGVPRAS
jgi:very-short-patch-repair endonuclease